MRRQLAVLALIVGTGLSTLWAVPAVPSGDQAKITQLIAQLGSSNFRERDAANRELDAIGEPALSALKVAAKSGDMETANRAAALVAGIEKRSANAKLLTPTYVELNLKDSTVAQAIAELSKQSGYQIVLNGDRAKLGARPITIETGKVPFWKAVEVLCQKADLVESAVAVATDVDVPGGINVLPVQVRPLPARIKPLPVPLPPVQPIENDVPQQDVEKPAPLKDLPQNFSADEKADEDAKRKADEEAKAKEVLKRAQAQPAVQIQIQPIQGGGVRTIGRPQQAQQQNVIVLVDGKSAQVPTHVEGAVRVRAIHNPDMANNWGPIPAGELAVLLEIKAEPKLQVLNVVGTKVEKALDNYDQNLDQSLVANANEPVEGQLQNMPIQQIQIGNAIARPAIGYIGPGFSGAGNMNAQIRLKKGEKESKSFKELRGVVTLQIRTPAENLITVENLLKAKGETVKGQGDCTMKILGVTKEANGDIRVEVELSHSHDIQPKNDGGAVFLGGGNIQGNIQIRFNNAAPVPAPAPPAVGKAAPAIVNSLGIDVLDDKGNPVPLVQMLNKGMQFQPTGRTSTATMTYRPKKDQEVSKLVFQGTRPATVDVPFMLKDVVVK